MSWHAFRRLQVAVELAHQQPALLFVSDNLVPMV
jgi:hypothetical protein